MSNKLIIYAEIFGLSEDGEGEAGWAGVKAEIVFEKGLDDSVSYAERIENIDKKSFLKFIKLEEFPEENIRFITPEEYDENYE
ncbi:MAG: hypothetical protein EHM25_01030 [Nitrosopumilales archaeon]|nr:MAG: hypothetical protein EHM25_12670 [Nitrosopumilales archaeon]RPJ31555.1 MAG: hypothetical protein EHM25_02660 [Nitrosopumilales archaeon]RPJ32334.1 MAG: hypothetical protein EHM25_01030 [Nitrosopumilales archaeon]